MAVLLVAIAADLTIALQSAEAVATDPPPRSGPAAALAMFALAATGAALALAGIVVRRRLPGMVVCALGALNGAAVLFVLGRALTYNVYGSVATRHIVAGTVRPAWIVLLALIAVVATAMARRLPGAGLFVSGLFLLLCVPSAFLAGITFH